MASPVPAKSQPLHNFSLPQLKWKKNHTNNLHRGRRLTESPPPPPIHQSPPRRHQSPLLYVAPKHSPMRESASESESGLGFDHRKSSAPEGIKNSGSAPPFDDLIEKSDMEGKSKIYIRLRKSKVADSVEEENYQDNSPKKDEDHNQEKGVAIENRESEAFFEPKTWNLRPRKHLRKQSNVNNGGTIKIQENKAQIRPDANTNPVEKEKKQKFSITLERDEIEEDIFLMTGSRPSRKPKKRAKIVQKQLDNLFPGMWLSSITPDCYKVPDPPIKG